ncbi:hypothetical protein DCAR_0100535 [Daucus carota subsp. sativus]|uniref:Transcription factor TFIIIC triple barrel domain-containing protein n=1 Tax=Daucus carota subsp. sativus TaxID=79200 RepID=A0A162AZJ1_DAUCS|nr:PREDICTED: uncharacterized protein LOC108210023 [Daucus carota subsp. sativus]XP_017236761.1 PREDICTED: uncharacterized protein LOC108210023 [Daucus carota subsp. sativus]WOG81388.1 hypothetical protein DCAR_0100535 [Daucus carota subsp. sativus]
MATMSVPHDPEKVEEEFVLLDLNAVSEQVEIQPNAPYVLSGLDTLNPTLIINNKLKLVGEYVETIGTCLVFSESDATPVVHVETGPSEANLFSGACIIDPNQASSKQVKPVAQLQKILKFRLAEEVDCRYLTADRNAIAREMNDRSTRTKIQYDHMQGTS